MINQVFSHVQYLPVRFLDRLDIHEPVMSPMGTHHLRNSADKGEREHSIMSKYL